MSFFIRISCVFAIGCSFGWILEVIFRRFWSGNNSAKRWVNPGYLRGPWLPVYGFGLCALYFLSGIEYILPIGGITGRLLLIAIMTFTVTVIELLAGLVSEKLLHTMLWDYSGEWGNFMGLICPRFSLFWGIACAVYVSFIHGILSNATETLRENAAFSIFTGIYLGLMSGDAWGMLRARKESSHIFIQ